MVLNRKQINDIIHPYQQKEASLMKTIIEVKRLLPHILALMCMTYNKRYRIIVQEDVQYFLKKIREAFCIVQNPNTLCWTDKRQLPLVLGKREHTYLYLINNSWQP